MLRMTITRITPLGLALVCGVTSVPAAQQLSAVTMPLKDGNTDVWEFFGDTLVGVDIDRGLLKMGGRINAYSVSEGKPLWRHEVELGYKMNETGPVVLVDANDSRLLLGTGPISSVGLDGPKWTLTCDQAGPINLDGLVQLPPDRLLMFGNDNCGDGFKDDPQVLLVDGATGRIVWSHKSKGQWFDEPGGYWARVASYQGKGGGRKTLQFRVFTLAPDPRGHVYSLRADADRVVIVGERLEVLNLADGALLWKSPQKIDRFEGLYGPFVFLRDGDKLSAVKAGTGDPGWSMDLDRAGTTLYSARDLEAQGDSSPLGDNDLLVSENQFVSRVNLLTGEKKWTVRRGGGAGWQASPEALLVRSEDAIRAFDWESGAQRWELKQGPYLFAVGDPSLPVLFLVDRGKREDGKWVGPYKFVAADKATGRVVWSRGEIEGKKITSFAFSVSRQVRLTSEAGKVLNVSIADGSPGVAPPDAATARFVEYSAGAKSLVCRNYAGDVVWERKAEVSERQEPIVLRDVVVWAAKSGDVEVIALSDGASRWKVKAGGNPRVWVGDKGRQLVVPNGQSVSVVRLTAAATN
ncbi:MAG TPA: PQQ-binding-like beta-propeller repeat protein [Methylomirabilota bacterium]|nr:PQQ-binding-like beta-propeller repeat protein [Methylomirabilota bacterium]